MPNLVGTQDLKKVPLRKQSGFFAEAVPLYMVNISSKPYPLIIPVEITDNTGAYTNESITLSSEDVLLLLRKI